MTLRDEAEALINALMIDMDNRSLLDGLDEDVRREMLATWLEMVAARLERLKEEQ